jgi:hypothetical protein
METETQFQGSHLEPEYQKARRRVLKMKGFYIHLTIYVLVMILLVAINIATGPEWWVQWPFLGWGIGLAAHGLSVFGAVKWLGPEWEERKIKELMAKK